MYRLLMKKADKKVRRWTKPKPRVFIKDESNTWYSYKIPRTKVALRTFLKIARRYAIRHGYELEDVEL